MSAIPFEIRGTDHVGFIVGNAKQTAVYYQRCFGFEIIGYQGLETGNREVASYVLRQGKITLVLSTPLGAESELNDHLRRHGDAVRNIALWVDDAAAAFAHTSERGARVVHEPRVLEDEHGKVITAAIATYGDVIHTFVQRDGYSGVFLPGFIPYEGPNLFHPVGLEYVDHIVGNQADGQMEPVVRWYQDVFGFERIWTVDDKDVSTEFTALRSVVVANANERIKMPINEPAAGKKKSQIEEYVDFHGGAGVQHVAMYTRDIIATTAKLVENGVEFLAIPRSYYEMLPARVGAIDEEIQVLAGLGILVDRDDQGYLLQLFTKPVQDRPTLFFEIIQRKGARSFGKGNFKALFESIEREQERRGNL